MRIPESPPDTHVLFEELFEKHSEDPAFFARLMSQKNGPAPDGRYRHWHKLQYLQPPAGLSRREWWLAIKMARRPLLKDLPLKDSQGRPFQYAMTDLAWEMAHRIDKSASGAIKTSELIDQPRIRDFYLLRSLREEAITSSQMEGAVTTRKVAKRMLEEGRKPRNKSEIMIHNNFLAMQHVQEIKNRNLTPEMVFELHGIVTRDTLDEPDSSGRFRTSRDEVIVGDEQGRVLHKPPNAEELPSRLSAMCDFANRNDGVPFIHPVVQAILLHFWLAYDHPFVDGNGRTARALFYWAMARRGYWLIEFTSISRLLNRARSKYNRAFLYSETDENDATYFVLNQFQVIIRAIEELHKYLERKTREAQRTKEILRESALAGLALNHRQLALVRHAIDHPGFLYTIETHRRYHNVSYQTARNDLLELSELKLLPMSKQGRKFLFLSPDDLRHRL